MKTIGIIGGVGPESTIDYYRRVVAGYREQVRDGSYPPILINSIDLNRCVHLISAGQLAELTDYLVSEVHKLAKAGAEVGLIAANTAHIVFKEVRRQSPIPLVSIVEATCQAAKARGLKKLGLLGTRFTMQGRFYPEVFTPGGIALVTPQPAEQDYVHDKYMGELVPGIFLPETRERLLAIVDGMKEREAIQGVILAGTELPLLLRDASHKDIPFLDTAKIHVDAILAQALA
ncbi:MAG TPA: amino acid racemase [Terriglobales bacterium]|nr:amino acid racemase [Terriglobales bacterium]